MPADPRKRQKKLERKNAKRKNVHQQIAKARAAGLPERLTQAAAAPVLDCWTTPVFDKEGLGQLGLSRRLPTGDVAVAIFLVDRYCLGVKNTLVDIMPPSRYERRVRQQAQRDLGAVPLDPPSLRKIVEEAVAYARSLGFSPDPDYDRGRRLFGDIDPAQAARGCEFGEGGKPYFIAGPADTPERCRLILRTLADECGPTGFHYFIPPRSEFYDEVPDFAAELGLGPEYIGEQLAAAPDAAPDAAPPELPAPEQPAAPPPHEPPP